LGNFEFAGTANLSFIHLPNYASTKFLSWYGFRMITGLHAILYSPDADKVRAFLRDVLGLKSVDAGHGWLIFAAPPAELAAHPTEANERPHHELYLMCDDLSATIKDLEAKGVKCEAITEARWGLGTSIHLPGGGELGLYQPKHPTAVNVR
jgi:catechol 2,3-dioxygenase-like lactoylglutathione lyase family enzyme